jgi:hypothetical protein
LNPIAQQAMDSVRIIGNNAVHPGTINDADLEGVLPGLFLAVSYIVEDLITRPKEIGALYGATPQSARDGVARRDAKGSAGTS